MYLHTIVGIINFGKWWKCSCTSRVVVAPSISCPKISSVHASFSRLAKGEVSQGLAPTHPLQNMFFLLGKNTQWDKPQLFEKGFLSWSNPMRGSWTHLLVVLWSNQVEMKGRLVVGREPSRVFKTQESSQTCSVFSWCYVFSQWKIGLCWQKHPFHPLPLPGVFFRNSQVPRTVLFDGIAAAAEQLPKKSPQGCVKNKSPAGTTHKRFRWRSVRPVCANFFSSHLFRETT